MKDQYSFLKAIDTSSSSPELLNEAEAALRRSHQKTAQLPPLQLLKLSSKIRSQSNGQHNQAANNTTNSSSSIESKTPSSSGDGARHKGNILTNLVRPIKFHSQPKQQQQQVVTMRKSQNEKPESDLRDRLFSLAGSKQQLASKPSQGVAKLLGAPRLTRPPVVAPVASTFRSHHTTRHHHVPPPPPQQQPLSSQHTNNSNSKTTSSGSATAVKPNHYLPSENSQPHQAAPELAKCYDEIDQIYDYIRGLAPLPVNLRKIKSIDFEQLERERQRLAERQQQRLQVQVHQHRERYVRSIDDSTTTTTSHSASVASTQPSSSATATKRLVKVRQRDASDQNHVRPPPTASAHLVAPMPIRVTTRTGESARPSIKRVESLNLGQLKQAEVDRNSSAMRQDTSRPLMTASLSKPSYLISTTQRGQVFRLPRAHSTSTLNKPALAGVGQAAVSGRRASQAVTSSKEPVIQEELPLAASRLSTRQPVGLQTGSLSRPMGQRVPGFESDLVESFVDDNDDDDEEATGGHQQVATKDKKSFSSQSQDSSATSSSSSSSGSSQDDVQQSEAESSSTQASERLSQKSHSDYDNDSDANTSETETTETSSETTTNTSNEKEREEIEEVRARARALKREHHHHHHAGKTSSSMSPFSTNGGGGGGGSSSTGKRSQRPTTSSSPSSGRPASPADETQPESDGPEASMSCESSRRRKSASSTYRHLQLPRVQPTPRDEHIYEQIPAHKTRGMPTTIGTSRVLCADQPIGMTTTTTSQSTLTRRAPDMGSRKPVIKHPVAYAANVAVNRRYQQQVAALFALQQQRDRQLAAMQPPLLPPVVAPQMCHQGHRRRASASNTQFLAQPWRQPTSSSNHHHNHHPHPQQHLSNLPHRHRFSMGNIHLLTSAIPLASLYSPKGRNVPSGEDVRQAKEERHRRRSQANANSLDDHEACSTGTTNSTSSYEAAIKNSEPNPLSIDMLVPTPDNGASEQRCSASRRSVGSGSGSRSLSNHLQMHNAASNHHLHHQSQQQQHSSSLVKVPKLSKQSHLLQRPLPKPPSHQRSSSSTKQTASKSTSSIRTKSATRPPVVDVAN